MARLGQTVAVVNKSGKVVSNSKSLIGVFKEAKSIYGERKAEIKAKRKYELEEQRTRRNLDNLTLDDTRSRASSRHRKKPSSRHHSHQNSRPERPAAAQRGFTDTAYRAAEISHDTNSLPPPYPRHEFIRRHTDGELVSPSSAKPHVQNYAHSDFSDEAEDRDLAYGDLPITDLPQPQHPRGYPGQEVELRNKMSNLTRLLDEANCLQYSVTTMIEVLQKDPDRLAAVGLALAEISTLARAAAPGALMTMKSTFPAAVALLASPQFMIAGGVALGVTVVALGGYKIIKKIKAQQEDGDDDFDFFASFDKRDVFGKLRNMAGGQNKGQKHVDEIREIGGDLSRIELWRRGIAEAEAASVCTSVDGEFVTQNAGRQLVDEGVLQPGQVRLSPSTTDADGRRSASKSKGDGGAKKHKSSRSGRENGRDRDRDRERSSRHSQHNNHHHSSHKSRSERSDRSARDGDADSVRHRKKKAIKDKEPSGLKMLFKS